jgi:hypothetical protein
VGTQWVPRLVSQQLRRAGVTMRRGAPPSDPASTHQILELRDQGLTWTEIAERVGMTRLGVWSGYRKAGPPHSRHRDWADGSRCSPTRLITISRFGVRAAVADHLGRAPTRAELTAVRRAAHSFAALGRARLLHCRVPMGTTMPVTAATWCWRSGT